MDKLTEYKIALRDLLDTMETPRSRKATEAWARARRLLTEMKLEDFD